MISKLGLSFGGASFPFPCRVRGSEAWWLGYRTISGLAARQVGLCCWRCGGQRSSWSSWNDPFVNVQVRVAERCWLGLGGRGRSGFRGSGGQQLGRRLRYGLRFLNQHRGHAQSFQQIERLGRAQLRLSFRKDRSSRRFLWLKLLVSSKRQDVGR